MLIRFPIMYSTWGLSLKTTDRHRAFWFQVPKAHISQIIWQWTKDQRPYSLKSIIEPFYYFLMTIWKRREFVSNLSHKLAVILRLVDCCPKLANFLKFQGFSICRCYQPKIAKPKWKSTAQRMSQVENKIGWPLVSTHINNMVLCIPCMVRNPWHL